MNKPAATNSMPALSNPYSVKNDSNSFLQGPAFQTPSFMIQQ
jgi:hypothetical protein